jgi:glycosyltransferase involved in cell wall biosynthesis
MRPLVVIPAFNEADGIAEVLLAVRAADPSLPVLVVDDGSIDDTAGEARRAGAEVLRLPLNLGYGSALQAGYKYALRHGYDGVVQIDGDGQHEPADIPRLLATLQRGDVDLVLGSRFLEDVGYQPGVMRALGMRLFRGLAFLATGRRFSDVTSGYQALNRDVLQFFATERYPADYPDADVLIMVTRAGFRVAEVPVRMYAKRNGRTMHAGLRPVYYTFKMLLSMLLMLLRDERHTNKGH